jgi:sulfate transport system ATP-binding protein
MSLKIDKVAKAFGRFPALGGVSLDVAQGEFLALLGPSGSGKTTLLRILAGLERPDSGTVAFQGEDFLALSARERRVGMVFQHYALFRHMTVAQNIAFGLKVRPRRERPNRKAIESRVADLLRLVQLEGLEKRYPAQLSGGQRQRVALARALAIEPRVLLLDEPFGALDAKVRRELRKWLRHVHNETGVTTVFVTHDQEEALDLADRVAILKDGKLIQTGAPQEVYDNPATPFVFDFLGEACHLPGKVEGGKLTVEGWTMAAPAGAPEGPVNVYFRPHELSLEGPEAAGIPATVQAFAPKGATLHLTCKVGEREIDLEIPGGVAPGFLSPGAIIHLVPKRMTAFAAA